jgi:hypothetical protein
MRKWILLAGLAVGLFTAGALNAPRAEAMTFGTPAGVALAAEGTNLAEEVAYVCRRVWRCGPYGCGWRRNCWWSGPRYYGPRYFGPRPYPHWRYRHGRRW